MVAASANSEVESDGQGRKDGSSIGSRSGTSTCDSSKDNNEGAASCGESSTVSEDTGGDDPANTSTSSSRADKNTAAPSNDGADTSGNKARRHHTTARYADPSRRGRPTSGSSGGAMVGPDGYYYYAEDVDHVQGELEFCWKVVAVVMGLLMVVLSGAFFYQLYELWELSELSDEMKQERMGDGNSNNIMSVSRDARGDIGAKPFEISLPQECIAMRSALPDDNESCRMALARAVTPTIRRAFKHEGVVAIRGLLTPDQIASLDVSADQLLTVETERQGGPNKARSRNGNQFYADKSGALFLDPGRDGHLCDGGGEGSILSEQCDIRTDAEECPATQNSDINDEGAVDENEGAENSNTSMAAFRHVALMSAVPLVAAELMGLDSSRNDTLRVIKDIFLAKDEGEYVCGWHVDDHGFWPAQASSPGINAWITVDDLPPGPGGTFAVAVGSHSARWRMDAHRAIGSVMTYPQNGFKDAEDMVKSRPGEGTCNLKTAAPETNEKMEDSKRIYDLKKGDVIFHERWLFHRTVPFDREVVHNQKIRRWGYKGGYEKEPPPPLMKRRYSIRYGPGSSIVIKGWGTEPSVLWNKNNAGKTADEVSENDGPWYPRSWPGISCNEIEGIGELVEKRFAVVEERKKERMKAMKMHLKELKEEEREKRTLAYNNKR